MADSREGREVRELKLLFWEKNHHNLDHAWLDISRQRSVMPHKFNWNTNDIQWRWGGGMMTAIEVGLERCVCEHNTQDCTLFQSASLLTCQPAVTWLWITGILIAKRTGRRPKGVISLDCIFQGLRGTRRKAELGERGGRKTAWGWLNDIKLCKSQKEMLAIPAGRLHEGSPFCDLFSVKNLSTFILTTYLLQSVILFDLGSYLQLTSLYLLIIQIWSLI